MREEILVEKICRGYDFLFRNGRSKGHWDEARNTALVGLALEYIEPSNSGWGESIKDFLIDNQMHFDENYSSWGEEIWDTSMSLIALNRLGYDNREKPFKTAISWIVSLHNQNKRLNWHDEPWETSWAVLAILEADQTQELMQICIDSALWLISLQNSEGKIVAPHYTAYAIQICTAILENFKELSAENKEIMTQSINKAKEFLLSHVDEDNLWQGEAWANGQILWILASNELIPANDSDFFWRTVNWFVKAQDKNTGKWEDVEGTSSALLGLGALLIRRDKLKDKFELRNKLKTQYQVPGLMLKRKLIDSHEDGYVSLNVHKKVIAILTVLGSLAGGLVFILEFWNNIKSFF